MDLVLEYTGVLLSGVGVTIRVTLYASVVVVIAATLGGMGRLSSRPAVRWAAGIYIEFFRGTSALVQMFWLYFAMPFVGIQFTPMQAGVLALGLNVGAYASEVVRAGILAVPDGQREAARALNLSRLDMYRYVITRQALQVMIPPFNNLFITLMKGTALVSLITLADLTFRATHLREITGQSTLILTLTLFIYLGLSAAITIIMKALGRMVAYPGSHSGGAAQ